MKPWTIKATLSTSYQSTEKHQHTGSYNGLNQLPQRRECRHSGKAGDIRQIHSENLHLGFSSNTTTVGLDGPSDTDCEALEKRRMYLNLAEPSFG